MQHFHNSLAGRAGNLVSGFTDDRMRVAAEMLIAGVAFQISGKSWNVISHDGDFLSEMSTYVVCETTRALKQLGLKVNHITDVNRGEEASITFGHSYPYPDELEQIMRRRSRKETVIH